MKMTYTVNTDFTIQDVAFAGCTGLERVGNIKEALGFLQLENPAVAIRKAAKEGQFNDMSDEDYHRLLATFKCITNLFHYPDDPRHARARARMNVLTLLANAITEIVRLHTLLEAYTGE